MARSDNRSSKRKARPPWKAVGCLAAWCLGAGLLASCSGLRLAASDSRPALPAEVGIAGKTGVRPVASSVPRLYDGGKEIKAAMLALIESANDYILIDSYAMVIDSVTKEVLDALVRKRREGVRVHVIGDSTSHFGPTKVAGFDYLRKGGVSVVEHNPMVWWKLLMPVMLTERDHRKFWIVDGRVLFLGSANIMDTSIESYDRKGNRDIMVSIESRDAIREMIASFVKAWNEFSREKLRVGDFAVRARANREAEAWMFNQEEPGRHPRVIPEMMANLLRSAEREVWLVQAFTIASREQLALVREATARGVEVNLVLTGEAHGPQYLYGPYYGIVDLLRAGAKVWVYKPGQGPLHGKLVVIDDRWASVGSANFNPRSFDISKEVNVVFGDPKSVHKFSRLVEDIRKNCRQVGMEEAKRYRDFLHHLSWAIMQWAA